MDFYQGKRVFVTGHTGFKGSYLCLMLASLGAKVCGYALAPEGVLFNAARIGELVESHIGDVRDFDLLKRTFDEFAPEIVIHMAAQPIVRKSYEEPRETYETNVMGTVNVLECVRQSDCVKSVLNVTTDKVYKNFERMEPYREGEMLDGYDPYSNSKSCSDILTHSYRASFLEPRGVAVSCARAGNVIGGGDDARDRLIPDCVRAAMSGTNVIVRNPDAVRPFQFVAEPLTMYLTLAARQYEDIKYAGEYNIGPIESDCVSALDAVKMFCTAWGNIGCEVVQKEGVHEANLLRLDSSLIRKTLGYEPKTDIRRAIENVCEWTRCYMDGDDVRAVMQKQLEVYGI